MTTPTTLPNTPDAISGNYTTDMFGVGLSQSEGINEIIADILQSWTKLGIGASTPIANTVLRGNGTGTSGWSQVQTGDITANAITQRASTASFTGTRTAAPYADVDSTNGKVTLTTTGGDLLAFFFGSAANSSASVAQFVALRLDTGSDVGGIPTYSFPGAATYPVPFCIPWLFTSVSAASHSITARHSNGTATGTMTTTGYLIVVEIKK